MRSTTDWFLGFLAFALVGGGLISMFQAERQTRAMADKLGKQNDDEWQRDRVSRTKTIAGVIVAIGVAVLLLPLLT